MRIGIINRANIADVGVLSGSPYFMGKALERHVGDVAYVCADDSLGTKIVENAGRCLNYATYTILGKRISPDHNRILSKRLARTLGPRVLRSKCDVLFAPNASVEIACLETDVPIIYSSDLNWADFVDYYPPASSLFEFARAAGDRIEAAACGKASALVYPSAWAARTAIEHYRKDPRRVHCIPYGANFEMEKVPPRDLALLHPLGETVNLLWVGVDWERKGGAIAHECLMELLSSGVQARLVVCGCIPPRRFDHPKIEVIPFLDKRDPVQFRKLSQLFLDANFFLFPTMAEAFGMVLSEASAHGLPSLVRNTGGVGGAIVDEQNGFLLPPDAKGKQYAEKIVQIVESRSVYKRLVQTSRAAYEERLNWDAWARSMQPIFQQVLGSSD